MFKFAQVSKFINAQWSWRFESRDTRTRNHQETTEWVKWKSVNLKKSFRKEDFILIFRIRSNKEWNEREGERSPVSKERND